VCHYNEWCVSFIMLNVILWIVVMLSVVAPTEGTFVNFIWTTVLHSSKLEVGDVSFKTLTGILSVSILKHIRQTTRYNHWSKMLGCVEWTGPILCRSLSLKFEQTFSKINETTAQLIEISCTLNSITFLLFSFHV